MTSTSVRHTISQERWAQLTLMEQLANVGSEVERAIRAHGTGQMERFDNALIRALDLFDLTAADERWRGPKRREILRAREEFCGLFFGDGATPDGIQRVQRYFLAFAAAVRNSRDQAAS